MMKKCLIAAASNWYAYTPIPGKDTCVIGVDGGYNRLAELQIDMDLIVGDFDSMERKEIRDKKSKEKIIELKREKDDTDTLFAIKMGLVEGCLEFHIFGGTGGRTSHTIANMQCLAFIASKGARGFLYGKDYIMTCITKGEIHFEENRKGYISVFSHSDISRGVSIKGLKYELYDSELSSTFPIGVSNEFIGKKSEISVKEGILLIVYPNMKRRIEI